MKVRDFTLTEIEPNVWELKKTGKMVVPGRIYGSKGIIKHLTDDVKLGKEWNALQQVYDVAHLPGLQKASFAMPDVHPGYGFPIGGIGAFDWNKGVVSFAGVGFDANCGVRDMILPLTKKDILKKQKLAMDTLYEMVPAGLGSKGDFRLSSGEIDDVLIDGAKFAVQRGYGFKEDLKFIEENGTVAGAKPENVSTKAKQRQFRQVGTLGSGNHYMEIQYVHKIFDEKAAKAFGLEKDGAVLSFHTGSRALGHQVGTDYLKELHNASLKYKIPIRERELVCAPITSKEGQKYLSAEFAAFNCAFANRQALSHLARKALSKVFGVDEKEIKTLYDIGHNTCKIEKHNNKKLLVHRKGATRAFGPGRKEIPTAYRKIGQPVLIGGTMGTSSFVLVGTNKGMKDTYGSACHGAGRRMSRHQAIRSWRGEDVLTMLKKKGILVKGHGWKGLAEEAPDAYKDVQEVIDVTHNTGIATKVAELKPLVCIKG
tara:strand:- start:1079 stop:2530 length:1452 start_codon:yes stop_codon:yes gene_type:complete